MKDAPYAIDLGTTNTVVARWNNELGRPEIIRLDSICRNVVKDSAIDDSYTIPSSLFLLPPSEVYGFPFRFFFKNRQKKTGALIGSRADARDGGLFKEQYITRFKPLLGANSYRFIGKLGKWKYTPDDAARIFLNNLFSEIKETTGASLKEMTYCIPVDFYEFYRARLQHIAEGAGMKKIKTIDEPVAAALGYGLSLDDRKNILVIDFGGGTLDYALIKTEESARDQGRCTVVAKEGIPLGGNVIDGWLLQKVCEHYGYNFDTIAADPSINWWFRMLLAEACRIKESLFLKDNDTFYLLPSSILNSHGMAIPGSRENLKKTLDISKTEFAQLLETRGLYEMIDRGIDSLIARAEQKGIGEDDITDVLLVGGSTLLPGVYKLIEDRFGRDRVRAWQPFNAVAFGAAAFAAEKIYKDDHITHDYAFLTYDRESHEKEYNIIIPSGTPFPTRDDFWKRQLIPTCALGVPERLFKLVICEIGKKHAGGQEFAWDEKGKLHSLDERNQKSLVVPLNEDDPTLGFLDPPHSPGEKRARVELSFMINEDRWLCATVFDLKTGKHLFTQRPVIRLK